MVTGDRRSRRRRIMSAAIVPFAVQADEGPALRVPTGDAMVIKVESSQSGGTLSVMDLIISPDQGPALHTHSREDELWIVLDGRFRFKAGGRLFEASAGGMAFGPRGTAHCFHNVDDTPGRLLIVTTPGGLEDFFRDFAAEPDLEKLGEIGRRHGVDFNGPPLSVSDPL
jgi:mannose-6-phosphate isomerase-like protein (cupin superfamily)